MQKVSARMVQLTQFSRGKLAYYNEIKDQLQDTTKDVISKADDISAEVDNLKKAKKALED